MSVLEASEQSVQLFFQTWPCDTAFRFFSAAPEAGTACETAVAKPQYQQRRVLNGLSNKQGEEQKVKSDTSPREIKLTIISGFYICPAYVISGNE